MVRPRMVMTLMKSSSATSALAKFKTKSDKMEICHAKTNEHTHGHDSDRPSRESEWPHWPLQRLNLRLKKKEFCCERNLKACHPQTRMHSCLLKRKSGPEPNANVVFGQRMNLMANDTKAFPEKSTIVQ